MQPDATAYLIGAIIGGLIAGALCGSIPLALGLKREKKGLATAGMICCVVGGGVLGLLLAGPLALIFSIIILCTPKPAATAGQDTGQSEFAPPAEPKFPSAGDENNPYRSP